jgi:hypothetical protein
VHPDWTTSTREPRHFVPPLLLSSSVGTVVLRLDVDKVLVTQYLEITRAFLRWMAVPSPKPRHLFRPLLDTSHPGSGLEFGGNSLSYR